MMSLGRPRCGEVLHKALTSARFRSVSVPDDTKTSMLSIWPVRAFGSAGYRGSTLKWLASSDRKR